MCAFCRLRAFVVCDPECAPHLRVPSQLSRFPQLKSPAQNAQIPHAMHTHLTFSLPACCAHLNWLCMQHVAPRCRCVVPMATLDAKGTDARTCFTWYRQQRPHTTQHISHIACHKHASYADALSITSITLTLTLTLTRQNVSDTVTHV